VVPLPHIPVGPVVSGNRGLSGPPTGAHHLPPLTSTETPRFNHHRVSCLHDPTDRSELTSHTHLATHRPLHSARDT